MRQQYQNILFSYSIVVISKLYTELNLNYRISTSGPVPWIWLKECNVRFFCEQHQMKFILKSLDYWPGALASIKTRSWKFKIQNHKILSPRVNWKLNISCTFSTWSMDFFVLKVELAVTLILQYLKTFNWSQCMSGKERFKYPLSPGEKGR